MLSAQLLYVFQGIFISRVSEEGPAARAGVRVGDKLLEVSQGAPVTARVGDSPSCQVLLSCFCGMWEAWLLCYKSPEHSTPGGAQSP